MSEFTDNRPIAFLDLDNTIFQSSAKTAENDRHAVAYFDRNGAPTGWMTAKQKGMVDMLTLGAKVIPNTARTLDQYSRTVFRDSFDLAILLFGAIVLKDGEVDKVWEKTLKDELVKTSTDRRSELAAIKSIRVPPSITAKELSTIDGCPCSCILSMKAKHGIESDIKSLISTFSMLNLEHYYMHTNGRELCLIPKEISKGNAMRYVFNSYFTEKDRNNRATIGLGDSFSDLSFMKQSDFLVVPSKTCLYQLF